MVLRSCQHIDVLWSWPNLPGLRLVIMLLVLRTSESAGHTGPWLGINFNWITESGSLHPSAGWLVMGDMSRAGPLWPMTPFNNVSSVSIHQSYHGVASNIYFKPGLQVASKNRNYYFALQFCKHVKAKVWERNECANEYFCWNIHNKVLFAWT